MKLQKNTDGSGEFLKQQVINILKKRDNDAFNNEFQKHEHKQIQEAIRVIKLLIPPDYFMLSSKGFSEGI